MTDRSRRRAADRRRGSAAGGGSRDAPIAADITTSRLLAWAVLQEFDASEAFLKDLFAAFDSRHALSPADRAAALDLATGVVRRRLTIDALLRVAAGRSPESVETDLWRVLRMGVQQLLFQGVPGHAAINETVQLCRHLDRERWTSIVNGVLRGIQRLLTDENTSEAAADAVPVPDGHWRRLTRAVFPDPESDADGYLSEAFSLPLNLVRRWRSLLNADQLRAACFHTTRPPRLTLRVNPLRASVESVAAALAAPGRTIEAGADPASLLLPPGGRVEQQPGFAEGWWSVQDTSAMAAGRLLGPQPGERILDLCAAPGGKTTHLAELSHDQARIVACDVSEPRLERIRENAERLGLQSITTTLIGRDGSGIPDGGFDAVLTDVPCSNTGVLNRRPEARWRFRESDLPELAALQLRILEAGAAVVRPGGRVVYSTCSLEREENQEVVAEFCRRHSQFRMVRGQFHVPGCPADGGWQALLVRSDGAA